MLVGFFWGVSWDMYHSANLVRYYIVVTLRSCLDLDLYCGLGIKVYLCIGNG